MQGGKALLVSREPVKVVPLTLQVQLHGLFENLVAEKSDTKTGRCAADNIEWRKGLCAEEQRRVSRDYRSDQDAAAYYEEPCIARRRKVLIEKHEDLSIFFPGKLNNNY
jgi:hypothetical protein